MSGESLQPEVELFIHWKSGETALDIREEPGDLAELLIAMNEEYMATKFPSKGGA